MARTYTKTNLMKTPIRIIQGAQYGSEAKGMVALALAQKFKIDVAVRTGSINAGHTIYHPETGERLAFQQLPVASVLPSVISVLGPGAYIHEPTLERELVWSGNRKPGNPLGRLFIDTNCGCHLDVHEVEAKGAGRNVKIGATGKGCAEAIMHKIKDRAPGCMTLFRDTCHNSEFLTSMTNVQKYLASRYHEGASIMLEGTQGSLLDLHCGLYPYVTSRQTTAAAWVAEAGLSPSLAYEVILVARMFPIRVAGRSGPMGKEISWPTLAERMNDRLSNRELPLIVSEGAIQEFKEFAALDFSAYLNAWNQQKTPWYGFAGFEGMPMSMERFQLERNAMALAAMSDAHRQSMLRLMETTTVTKRPRRIAEMNVPQLRDTCQVENASYVVLTFLNYVFPELTHTRKLTTNILDVINELQDEIECEIRYVTIGPWSEDLLEVKGDW